MAAHEHHNHDGEEDNYYLDQLCMVTLSGAFGGICLGLYFWKTAMLTRLLGPQFHPFVLVSGFTLLALAMMRAFSLWVQIGKEKQAAGHAHDHEHAHHDHPHEHGEHGHEESGHVHTAGCAHDHDDHDHAHPPEHGHAHHHHDHGPEDHDHGWAPWRYVVLLVPLIFFLLDLPNKGPRAMSVEAKFSNDLLAEAVAMMTPQGWSHLVYIGYLGKDEVSGDIQDYSFNDLSNAVGLAAASPDPEVRRVWNDKAVRVIGMYSPSLQSDREFRLVRFKLTCCVADAIPLKLPIVARERITHIKPNAWVRVTGRVEFRKRLDEIVPIIVVPNSQAVQAWVEDANPYN